MQDKKCLSYLSCHFINGFNKNSLEQDRKVRLHMPLLTGIENALEEIFLKGGKSDQVIPKVLKANGKWGSRDRSFVAENTYEIVRNKRLILYTLGLEEVLNKSIISEMLGAWLALKGIDTTEYFKDLDTESILERSKVSDPQVKYSMPSTLNSYIREELGVEKWYTELEAMSSPAEVFLRVNLNKVSKEKLKTSLESKDILTEEVNGVDTALRLKKRGNITATEEFRKGYFEIQDAGSQLISSFLNPLSGDVVIDACAGAGGKTLHLADLMKNKGRVIAMDVEATKLSELEKRAARNHVQIVTTQLISDETIAALKDTADKLLLDVPCSGLGVIKRNPDAKESLTVNFIEEIKGVQAEILQSYSAMLKKGGRMVYATCSILPSENRKQVDNFLGSNPEFTLIEDKQIWPSETGFDGFYMALMERRK